MDEVQVVQSAAEQMTRTMSHFRAVEKHVGSSDSSNFVRTSLFSSSTSRISAWPFSRTYDAVSSLLSFLTSAFSMSISDGPASTMVLSEPSTSPFEKVPVREVIEEVTADQEKRWQKEESI